MPRTASAKATVFVAIYREHFDYVWKSARRLGVPRADADDVVQETFLTVFRLLDSHEPRGSVRAWLFSLLFGTVLRHRRSRRGRAALALKSSIEALVGAPAREPERDVETNDIVRILEEILDKLSPDKRAALVLAEFDDKTVPEIAEILGISVTSAASRLRSARDHVKAGLARHRAREGWRCA